MSPKLTSWIFQDLSRHKSLLASSPKEGLAALLARFHGKSPGNGGPIRCQARDGAGPLAGPAALS